VRGMEMGKSVRRVGEREKEDKRKIT
jgi:hypothetical protein